MATTLRDFLEIPYDKLEEMNLATKEARVNRTPAHKMREKHAKYARGRKTHQGRHRVLLGPRGPAAHARLRQEVPAQVRRQPDVRRVVDSRLLAAGRIGSAARHRLAGACTGCRRTCSVPARCWCSPTCSRRTARRTWRTCALKLKAYTREEVRQGRHGLQRRERNRGLPVQGPRRRAALPRDRRVRVHQHRRLLPLAARRPAAHVHRHGGRSAARARASPTRRTTRKWRPRSSR